MGSKKQILHLVWTMMIFILFILWSNYLIHSNVALKKHQYQSSLSQDSAEGDLSDLYGRDDDYSDSLEGKKVQNGYRQLGLLGNFVGTHSYRDCLPLYDINDRQHTNCMVANAKMDQQNISALTAKVLELTKLNKVLEKRVNRLSRRGNRGMGYDRSDDNYY